MGTGVDLLPFETDSFLDTCRCICGVSSDERECREDGSKLIGVPRNIKPVTLLWVTENLGLGME